MENFLTLSENEAEDICRMYLLLKAGDEAGVKEVAIRMGYQSKYLDEHVIYDMMRLFLDSDGPEVRPSIIFGQCNCD